MVRSPIVRLVGFCTRHPWPVLVSAAVIAAAAGLYAVDHFAITTNVNNLLSRGLPSHELETQYEKVFSDRTIVAVVTAPTPELTEKAADRLAARLAGLHGPIRDAWQAGGGAFFERNGLLYLQPDQLRQSVQGLARAAPMIGELAGDPSLRGVAHVLSSGAAAVQQGYARPDDLRWPLTLATNTIEDVLAGRPASFSWRALEQGHPADIGQLRRIVVVDPVLDYSAYSLARQPPPRSIAPPPISGSPRTTMRPCV
jgi:uncharacterized protein